MPADMNDYFKKRQPNSGNNNKTPVSNNKNPKNGNGQPPQWILIAIIAIASLVFLKPFKIINSGEVGIKVRTGKFDETPLKAGFTLLYSFLLGGGINSLVNYQELGTLFTLLVGLTSLTRLTYWED